MTGTVTKISHAAQSVTEPLGLGDLMRLRERIGPAMTMVAHGTRQHPILALGIAFGAGALIATKMRGPVGKAALLAAAKRVLFSR